MISTGIECIDSNIEGGISPETVTLVYGEPETGKSTLAIQCAANCSLQNLKVLFVDCDNTFSTKRLAQIVGDKFDDIAELIILVKPKDFKEQTALVDRITEYTGKGFGLIIIDTFTSLYGAKVSQIEGKAFSINRELNRQLAILAESAKIRKIPVLITSQVRSVFDDPNAGVRPVATRVLTFWADTIISLKPMDLPIIKAIIEKSPANAEQITCYVQILEKGIVDAQLQT